MVNKSVRVTKAKGAVVEIQPKAFSASDLEANEVLIKNVAVASNPKNWKLASYGMYEGIEGNDVAGHIEAVGSDVKDLKKGDRVVAFTRMASGDKYGAYQPYTVAPAWTTAKFADNVSLEDGSTLPLAITTAFVGLFDKLGIPEPTSDGKPATGADKITLLPVLPRTLRELGVNSSKIVDYRDDRATVIANLNKAAGGSAFTHVYDCITSQDTVETIVELLSTAPNKGGKVTTVLSSAYGDKDTNVKLQKEKGVSFDRTMCGSVHNDKVDFGTRWFKTVTEWTVEGKIKPNKVQLLDGGLDGVPAGLKLLQENKVSNRKLVARIADTKA
ncbi:related to toxD gene [Ustilago sp. UG-2017b]|nr:related to toxD gene [Ustilago sp. UG-2017b]